MMRRIARPLKRLLLTLPAEGARRLLLPIRQAAQSGYAACHRRICKTLAPKLGVLWQYPPRPMRAPPAYRCQLPKPAPVISVVTPSYNHAPFLERTMQSVLDQGYPGLEYIVQDGASKDETPAILERYRARLKHCQSCRDNGQADAINRGFRHATGDILAYLNSDDLLLPGALAYVADYFRRHPDVDVLYGHRIIVDRDDQEIGRWVLPPHEGEILSWGDYVPQETLFWRRRIWDAVGGNLDETFQFALDWDLLLRFRDAGARFARVPRFLGAFRVHPQQKTSANMEDIGYKEMKRLRLRCHGREVSDAEVMEHIKPYLRRHVVHRFLRVVGLGG
jgi:glycosyltransferase involved in cell wall biosynthesis